MKDDIQKKKGALGLLLLGVFMYGWLHQIWYASTLLGQVSMAGLLLHALCALAVFGLSAECWRSWYAGFLAALLYGLYPLAIHLAPEQDVMAALVFFMVGLYSLFHGFDQRRNGLAVACAALAGVCWGAASSLQPLFLWTWPVFLCGSLLSHAPYARRGVGSVLCLLSAMLCLAFFGQRSDAFHLWAANRPGAHGRYYVPLDPSLAQSTKPRKAARKEAEQLYRDATGHTGDVTRAEMNPFWRRKITQAWRERPAAAASLMLRKAYFLFNNFEQYDGKSYFFHKERSPILRYNPLCWGIVLLAGALALAVAFRTDAPRASALTLTAVCYATGMLSGYIHARARLPLAALLCVVVGGWALPAFWRAWLRPRALVSGLALLLVVGALTFSHFFSVADRSTEVRDLLLIAQNADDRADDVAALTWTRKALAISPDHPGALQLAVVSFYNMTLLPPINRPAELQDETWHRLLERVSRMKQPKPRIRFIQALAFWNIGALDYAEPVLRDLSATEGEVGDDALGALLLLGRSRPEEQQRAVQRFRTSRSTLLDIALLAGNPEVFGPLLQHKRYANPAEVQQALTHMSRVIPSLRRDP